MESISIKGLLRRGYVVIPEIQREYVWGNPDNEQILMRVIKDIQDSYNNRTPLTVKNLGFLYSYQKNKELYLIDGQQRFTSIVLIAFCIAIKEGKESVESFKNDFNVKSFRIKFSFRVRTETEIFLTNLFSNCTDIDTLQNIEDQIWYHDFYKEDVTISSMVHAIGVILSMIENSDVTYQYIMNNVTFWYFNVNETSQGEELYITMNSRGQNLETSEKLKPLLLEYARENESTPKQVDGMPISWAKAWDEWEETFFRSCKNNISTVEMAMSRLVRISIEIHTWEENRKSELPSQIDLLPEIERNFNDLKTIFSFFPDMLKEFMDKNDSYKPYRVHKSLIIAINKGYGSRDLQKVYHVIANGCRRGTIKKHSALLSFLKDFYKSDETFYETCLRFYDNIENKENAEALFSSHEILKIRMLNATSSEKLENIIWEAQQDDTLNGNIRCLWPEKFDKPCNSFNLSDEEIETLNYRWKAFKSIFNKQIIDKDLSQQPKVGEVDNSLISRALLSIVWDYSGKNIRGSQYAFGWGVYWKDIVANQNYHEAIAKILDTVSRSDTPYKALNGIIETSGYESKPKDVRYYILKYNYSLQAMQYGHSILWFITDDWDNYWINVLNGDNGHASNINIFRLMVYRLLLSKPEKKDIAEKLGCGIFCENNSLYLDCKQSHGWIVAWDDGANPNVEKLRTHFSKFSPAPYEDNTKRFISLEDVPLQKDLIEKGAQIAELICSYEE